jgi:hypothetical protein
MSGAVVHWISRDPINPGNVTACGLPQVFPMRGNGWRVREITCPDCDRAICARLAAQGGAGDEATVERLREAVKAFDAADWCDCYPQAAEMRDAALAAVTAGEGR